MELPAKLCVPGLARSRAPVTKVAMLGAGGRLLGLVGVAGDPVQAGRLAVLAVPADTSSGLGRCDPGPGVPSRVAHRCDRVGGPVRTPAEGTSGPPLAVVVGDESGFQEVVVDS